MLDKLFGTKLRVKLLKLFVLHPNEKFSIKDITNRLGLPAVSTRKELDNLHEFGLLQSGVETDFKESDNIAEILITDTGKEKISGDFKNKKLVKDKNNDKQDGDYFRVDSEFVLFEEIKALIIKSQVLHERDFVGKIKNVGKIKLFILTGFFANQSNAIVDILIVGHINKPKFIQIINDLEKELGREVNFTVMNTSEFKYRKDMTDVFLYNILEGNNITIIDELTIL